MAFSITWHHLPNTTNIEDRIVVLSNADNRLEVWPKLGFNAYRWQVAGQELLYRTAQFFEENRPTRSGFPILYPFPNRIAGGRFTWEGKTYQLPTTDSTKKNAIHGFVCQRPWRIIDQGADDASAWVTGEFHGSVDAHETLALWPADYRLRITYRLAERILRVEAQADNPDTKPLPFGLGYHPYFALAPFGGQDAILTVAAEKMWELRESLPTGQIKQVDEPHDLRHGKNISSLQLDDVMTGLYPFAFDAQDHLNMVAVLQHPSGDRLMTLWTAQDFREMVLFTPPHREAICLEPYTCTTDAVNLSLRGVDAGLRVLQPGERWTGVIEMHQPS
jgi:aldose 1-epimerase